MLLWVTCRCDVVSAARQELEDTGGEDGEGEDEERLPQPSGHAQPAVGEELGGYNVQGLEISILSGFPVFVCLLFVVLR